MDGDEASADRGALSALVVAREHDAPDAIAETLSALAEPENAAGADLARADLHAEHARSSNTLRAYRADLADFEGYCRRLNFAAYPVAPDHLRGYIASLGQRGKKFSTIRRRLTAIYGEHRARGFARPASDELRRTIQGMSRDLGTARAGKAALTFGDLREVLGTLNGSIRGTRDRAILLLGFAGAFRRSEIAALDVGDLRFSKRGLVVTLRRSKTDQEAAGREVGIVTAPSAEFDAVRQVRNWLAAAGISEGPVFRAIRGGRVLAHRIEGRTVAELVKRVTGSAGIEGDFSAHSLRSGFVTSAAEKGVSESNIARTTGHRSTATLRGYVRRANVLEGTALESILS